MIQRCSALAALGLTLALAPAAHAGPSPVGLGGAGAYAVLGGSGLTNTGVSTIEGDVGSSPTHSQTGFAPCPAANCVSLTGANHDVADPNDAQTQQAKADLVTAYDDAFGRTGGTAVTAPLGAGQTLVAGIYTSAADLFVGGDLTLDGGGDAGAVFIFQARTGTLNTAAGTTSGIPNTRVLLTNGAQACNVFWQVGSSAVIATSTQFAGTVMALQSITVNTGATLEAGRVLARNGAVTLDTNVIRAANCAAPAPASAVPEETAPTPSTQEPEPNVPGPAVAPVQTTTPVGDEARVRAPVARAELTGSRRPRGPFTLTVTGREIVSVTYFVDGRRVRRVHPRNGRARLRIDPRRQSMRMHRVLAVVRFTKASGATTVRLRTVYRRPALTPAQPRFAG